MTNKKVILFFLFSLSGGGAERTIVNIINNIDSQKYQVKLVLGSKKNNDYIHLVNSNIEIVILDCSKLRFCCFKLARVIRQTQPSLLFSTINGNNIIMLIAKLLSFRKTPAIVREASNRTQSGKVTSLNRTLTRLLYGKFSNRVIALSQGVKDDLVNNFSIKRNKIDVIYNPVEVEKISELSKERTTDLRIDDDEKIIIGVGRFSNAKDFQTLIKAFEIISRRVNSRLIILGKGMLENDLKQIVVDLGIKNKVQFLGFKNNPYKYMAISDLFVLSSRWEGFGNVIVEAMATGTPVLSTNCHSGPKEIIGENEYGRLSPVGDAEKLAVNIVDILTNDNLLREYSILGKRRSKAFSASLVTKKYEQIFDDIIKTKE